MLKKACISFFVGEKSEKVFWRNACTYVSSFAINCRNTHKKMQSTPTISETATAAADMPASSVSQVKEPKPRLARAGVVFVKQFSFTL